MKINELQRLLTSVYIDWSHVLANPQYIRTDTREGSYISWDRRVPFMLDHPVMASDIARLVDDRQYTFQILEDGSVIQIYYNYDKKGDELKSARLAFYSAKTDASIVRNNESILRRGGEEDIEVGYDEGENDLDEIDEFIENATAPIFLEDGPVSWLRIEYEPEDAKGVLHHACHMHFSAFPYSRFVVAGVPTPAQFIEFVMAFCYPDSYQKHRLNDQGSYISEAKIARVNATCFPLTESIVFSQMAHFRIPTVS